MPPSREPETCMGAACAGSCKTTKTTIDAALVFIGRLSPAAERAYRSIHASSAGECPSRQSTLSPRTYHHDAVLLHLWGAIQQCLRNAFQAVHPPSVDLVRQQSCTLHPDWTWAATRRAT